MVTEKVGAFTAFGQTVTAVGKTIHTATSRNARAVGHMMGGRWFGPSDWLALVESNVGAWTAMAALPMAALAPIHREVVGNDRRLRRRRRSGRTRRASA